MRRHPLRHPSASLIGSAPRRDGRWVSLWTTDDGLVCVTVGAVPSDASTAKRSSRRVDEHAARCAARELLELLWDDYLGDHALPRERMLTSRCLADLPLGGTVREAPVPRTTARTALQRAAIDAAAAA
jgi:hypothetical protein